MVINYVKYLNLWHNGDCNRLEFFSGYMDAFERSKDILSLKEKYGEDVQYDGNVGRFEYFNRKELIEELNKIYTCLDTHPDHII